MRQLFGIAILVALALIGIAWARMMRGRLRNGRRNTLRGDIDDGDRKDV